MPTDPLTAEPRLVAGLPPPFGGYDADINILVMGREADSIAAIASALAQRGGIFHVSVLDQGSGPALRAALISRFGDSPHFALYAAAGNLGVGGGRNALAAHGHGQVIIGLDNDAVFATPYTASAALRRLRTRPDLAALGFCILARDGRSPDLTSWGYPKPLLPRFRSAFETTTFVGAGHAIRRAAFTAAGGYDASLVFTWEEYDFCLAAISRGWRIAYDGQIAVIHQVCPEARITWHGPRLTMFIRNRLLIGRKWGEKWWQLAPRALSYAILGLRHGNLPAALEGIRQARAAPLPATHHMPAPMRAYLAQNETRHRGTLLARLHAALAHRLPA